MADLSPAQRIVAAFNERHELCGPFDVDWIEQCLAAAIRAAVERCTYTDDYGTEYIDPAELVAIAAELETTATDTP